MDFKFFLGIFQILEGEIYTQKRKVRGKNHNKKVSGLKNGEKLPIVFYNNRAVEENHQSWSRHLGRIVRNPNICPIRVKSWKERERSYVGICKGTFSNLLYLIL